MNVKLLKTANELAKETLIKALADYVMENGEEMSQYFYDEFGMDEEDEAGVKILKVYDTSTLGCFFARQVKTGDETLEHIGRYDDGWNTFEKLEKAFHYATYWSLYIVRYADGTEVLKYYRFYNDGVCYYANSEPDHDLVSRLELEDIVLIMKSLSLNL